LTTQNDLADPNFAVEWTLAYITKRTGQLINCGGGILGTCCQSLFLSLD
jgi:hypothetical protein